MAIQNNIAEGASQYGIAFNNAYYRIVTAAVSRQRGTDPKFTVMIDLSAYATATPDDDTREVDFKRYNIHLSSVWFKYYTIRSCVLRINTKANTIITCIS